MADSLNKKTWSYHNPVEVHFGSGQVSNLASFTKGLKAVLVTTPGFSKRGTVDLLKKILGRALVKAFDGVKPKPTLDSIEEAYKNLSPFNWDIILALGGGSVIDTAKAIAAIGEAEAGWLRKHLEKGADFPKRFSPKPIIAIPTTAGSGSEVTMWAVLWDMDKKKKYSLSHPCLYPKKAVLDPELTLALPRDETVSSGLDALSHAMEAVWNKNHNPVSDQLSLRAIELVYNYLPLLKNKLKDIKLREYLLQAGLMAGLAFSNTKTALAHSISYSLTAYFGLSHGIACSIALPYLVEFNGKRAPERVLVMAQAFKAGSTIKALRTNVEKLFKKLDVPLRLNDYGINKKQLRLIADSAFVPGRADNNIVDISKDELKKLLLLMAEA